MRASRRAGWRAETCLGWLIDSRRQTNPRQTPADMQLVATFSSKSQVGTVTDAAAGGTQIHFSSAGDGGKLFPRISFKLNFVYCFNSISGLCRRHQRIRKSLLLPPTQSPPPLVTTNFSERELPAVIQFTACKLSFTAFLSKSLDSTPGTSSCGPTRRSTSSVRAAFNLPKNRTMLECPGVSQRKTLEMLLDAAI